MQKDLFVRISCLYRSVMAFLLCCRRRRRDSSSSHPSKIELPPALKPASVVSVAIPLDTVPHRPTTGVDQARALREIFGASPSSHRGYQAAAKTSGSFDANFKFGGGDSPNSKVRARQSLDRFSQRLRQRFSQSRLSDRSSRKTLKDETNADKRESGPNDHPVQSLDDLLVSRTVSQGGYDSDAKNIKTPSWRKPSIGSVFANPEYTARLLTALGGSGGKSSDKANQLTPQDFKPTISTVTRSYSSPAKLSRGRQEGLTETNRSLSTQQAPQTPADNPLSTLLRLGPQESPSDALHRLSIGLANGMVILPSAPELKAMHIPEAMPELNLNFAAPRRSSSLHRGDLEVKNALKTLGDRIEKAKRDSIARSWQEDDKHASLISNLDPALLQYINQYGLDEHEDLFDQAAREDRDQQMSGIAHGTHLSDTDSHADTSFVHTEPPNAKEESEEKINHTKNGQSDPSVHLFDMRISQRLASTSVLPSMAPSSTNLGSFCHDTDRDSLPQSLLDRFPMYTGRTSTEHVRRPSDPNTRKLFEAEGSLTNEPNHSRWRSKSSFGPLGPHQTLSLESAGPENTNSGYLSDLGLRDNYLNNVSPTRRSSSTRANPNSLAMPGRESSLKVASGRARNVTGPFSHKQEIGSSHALSGASGGQIVTGITSEAPAGLHQNLKNGTDIQRSGAHMKERSLADIISGTESEADQNERMSEVDLGALLQTQDPRASVIQREHQTVEDPFVSARIEDSSKTVTARTRAGGMPISSRN